MCPLRDNDPENVGCVARHRHARRLAGHRTRRSSQHTNRHRRVDLRTPSNPHRRRPLTALRCRSVRPDRPGDTHSSIITPPESIRHRPGTATSSGAFSGPTRSGTRVGRAGGESDDLLRLSTRLARPARHLHRRQPRSPGLADSGPDRTRDSNPGGRWVRLPAGRGDGPRIKTCEGRRVRPHGPVASVEPPDRSGDQASDGSVACWFPPVMRSYTAGQKRSRALAMPPTPRLITRISPRP